MTAEGWISPIGTSAREAAERRAAEDPAYRKAREEYRAIDKLRAKNWIAAHARERRYELDLTQADVAALAGVSASCISRLEKGDHLPTIPVLGRVLEALGERLLLGSELDLPNTAAEREVAAVPAPWK